MGGKDTVPPTHEVWDKLLKEHVSSEGGVDYKGFIKDKLLLKEYLEDLSNHPPDRSSWSINEQLAYWVNAYNAFTIKLIVDHYPINSIQELHPTPYVPAINTVWHREFFEIGGKPASLDQIEHKILRKEFEEPRIHFAINCASFSCPPLRNEAYTPQNLDKQLGEQAVVFLNNPKWNQTNGNQVKLSSLFKWFKGDFTQQGDLRDFVNQYLENDIPEHAKISFMEYDWRLND